MDVHFKEHILVYNEDLEKVSHTSGLSFLLHIKTNASNHLGIQT